MSIFTGKSPEERNKIIAAVVLGALALLAIGYNLIGFFPGSGKKTATTSVSPTATATPATNNPAITALPKQELIDQQYVVTPVSVQYPPAANDAGRNIFAFYEPPIPTPISPTPPTPVPVIKTPTLPPPPTPNIPVTFISKQSAYAGEKGFRLDIGGSNFTPGTYIYWAGTQLPTNYISPQQLSADIPANFITGQGQRPIEVRSPDGKLFSNQVLFNILPQPVPQFQYLGVVARKRGNNDTAYIQEQGKTTPSGVRLNDILGGRFRLVSISPAKLLVQDINLGFTHSVDLVKGTGQSSSSIPNNPNNPNNPNFPPNSTIYTQPNMQQCPPGIPCNNLRPYQTPQPDKKDVDDEDDDNND